MLLKKKHLPLDSLTMLFLYFQIPQLSERSWLNVRKDAVIIELSTIDPNCAIEMHEYSKSKSRLFIDAPVSGGYIGAKNATLIFMVGADSEQTFEVKSPFFFLIW